MLSGHWVTKELNQNLKNHVDLMECLGIADTKKGAFVAGIAHEVLGASMLNPYHEELGEIHGVIALQSANGVILDSLEASKLLSAVAIAFSNRSMWDFYSVMVEAIITINYNEMMIAPEASMESIRESIAEELVKMTTEAELDVLRQRHSAALEFMGERDEEVHLTHLR
ncbi:hypothetical protein Tco_0284839 [Tanacetum coccineum]